AIQHLITNLVVDFADGDTDGGDRASARANLVTHFGPLEPQPEPQPEPEATPAWPPPLAFTVGELYRFDPVRTNARWRVQHIRTVPGGSAGTRELAIPA